MVTSPQGARDVLGRTDEAIDKTGLAHRQSRLSGDNVFNMANHDWLPRRRTLQPLFTRMNVATFAGHIAGAAQDMATAWVAAGRVDLDHECRKLTLQMLGRVVLGLELGERAQDLGPHTRNVFDYVVHRITNPVRLPATFPTPARKRFRRSLTELRAIVSEAIAEARADPAHDAPLVRLLLDATDPVTAVPLSDEAIVDELAAFLLAGHDTTSTALSYALWQLGRHPVIQQRVAAEVAELEEGPLRIHDMARLPYTVQVINEALRLCPPAAVVSRCAGGDVVVDGRRIPAGTNIFVGIWALHHDPSLWDEPERFDPDRFSPERSVGRNRWQYLPFGGGPRSCIGDHFARLEATLGLATLVRAVEITSEKDQFPLALSFTLTASEPIPARITVRNGAQQPG
jgi:cytochrome P450